MPPPLIVLDTMVVIRSVIGRRDGADSRGDEGLKEIARAMDHGDVRARVTDPVRTFEVGLDFGIMGAMHHPRKLDWPSKTPRTAGYSTWPSYQARIT